MRAIVIDHLDGPAAAHIGTAPEPLTAHERALGRRLLIDVHAVGLSPIDGLQSRGTYQYGAPPPYIPGSEVAGIVRETDADSGFRVGDRVAGIVFWGGLAERCVLAPEYTILLPDHVSFVEGAAVYLNYSTSWYSYERAAVGPGQTVLVHGAAGGVGGAALDLAPVFDARTIGVVSTDAKAAFARDRGADVVRSTGPWRDEVVRMTSGRGVDAVFDTVGGDRMTDSLRSLRIGGTLVVIGFVGGGIPEIRANRLLLRNLTVTGISMDSMDVEHPGTLIRVRDAVQALLADGRIHPRIGEVLPFERAPEAIARASEGTVIGKVVVDVAGDEVGPGIRG